MCNIRPAEQNDTQAILAVLESGRAYLQAQGSTQWQGGYGPARFLQEDLDSHWGYVLLTPQGGICGYASLAEGEDEFYTRIREGAWDASRDRYIAIHSVAIDDAHRGQGLALPFIQRLIEQAAHLGYSDIRIDTHRANAIMQNIIAKAGFTYRGVVEFPVPDGKRLAYQLLL